MSTLAAVYPHNNVLTIIHNFCETSILKIYTTQLRSNRIVEAQSGRIWTGNNADGGGATFAFSLPIITFSPMSERSR
jgi:hypothetical protein